MYPLDDFKETETKYMASDIYNEDFYRHVHQTASDSAREVVPLVLGLLPVRSVVDVGCGNGDWLAVFSGNGVEKILGLDGDWVKPDQLQIPCENFQVQDLAVPLSLGRTFDLVVSLEVAEHLPPSSAEGFVQSLVGLGPVVLFSAAIPRAGGTGHVNEQWPGYWRELFARHDYVVVDCLRRRVWNNPKVAWFYAQNMMMYVRANQLDSFPLLKQEQQRTDIGQLDLVHPGQYWFRHKDFATPGECVSRLKWLTVNAVRKRIRKLFGGKK